MMVLDTYIDVLNVFMYRFDNMIYYVYFTICTLIKSHHSLGYTHRTFVHFAGAVSPLNEC